MRRRACLGLLLALPLAACVSSPSQLAKTDIDRVAEAHRREVIGSLRLLAEKLYRRNPREWKKGGHESLEAAVARIFDPQISWRLPELEGRRGTEALLLAFREDFRGDRVAAFIGGLGGMLHTAFDEKTEFFMIDDLEPQKLHNSARNVEIAVWKLSGARDASGAPLLLSNEMGSNPNLSFEREFGKMIGSLDLLSKIVADKTNRTVVKVIQTMATAVFLPVL
ncbi:MAG: hypothetical protein Q8O34_17470 [Rhodocyclaceae bacterium]|nr:hypothetical protein [Rhodocyclaceae bacterium]